jgi:hypothetical protein
LHRLEVGFVVLQLGIERVRRRSRHLRRFGFDHRRDRRIAVESAIELLVALAPVQILGNQRIDVGVDGEVMDRVVARPHRQQEPENDDDGGKPGAGPDDGNDYALQHFFSFCVNSFPETPAVYRSSRAKPIAVLSGSSRQKVRAERREAVAKSCGAVGIAEELRRESDRGPRTKCRRFADRNVLYYSTANGSCRGTKVHGPLSLLPIF